MFYRVDGFAINMPVVILGCRKDKTGKIRPVGSGSLILFGVYLLVLY